MEGGLFSFFTSLAWAEELALKIKHMFLQVCGSRGPQRIVLGYGGGQGGSGLEKEILQSGYRQRGQGCCTVLSRKELRKYSLLRTNMCKLFCNV